MVDKLRDGPPTNPMSDAPPATAASEIDSFSDSSLIVTATVRLIAARTNITSS